MSAGDKPVTLGEVVALARKLVRLYDATEDVRQRVIDRLDQKFLQQTKDAVVWGLSHYAVPEGGCDGCGEDFDKPGPCEDCDR